MNKYHGSCHCGQVKFSINTIIDKVVDCNCSICTKKGILHHQISTDQFTLIEGEEALSLYQFDTKEAKHYYCKHCGIHPFNNPRSSPNSVSVNIRCLDNFDLTAESYKTIQFDGRNWELEVGKLRNQLKHD